MGRFTHDERRRIFLAQKRARQAMLASMFAAPALDVDHDAAGRRRRQLLTTAMLLTLLGVGFGVFQSVDVHPPTSLVEALLPRR